MKHLFENIYLFKNLDEIDILEICSITDAKHYGPHEVIIHEGERGNKFYVIQQGIVNVSTYNPEEGKKVIAQIKDGDFFGELAAFWDWGRTATVTTRTPTYLLEIAGEKLEDLMEKNPHIGYPIMYEMARELAKRGQESKEIIKMSKNRIDKTEKRLSTLEKQLKEYRQT